MYIKTGPAWSSIKKAYIKTGSVWKKIFDTTSNAPYSTEVPTIRLDSYTGTVVSSSSISYFEPTGESRVGIKLYGRENPASWRNGPFTSQKYQWWVSEFANGQDAWMIKETTDTFYSISSELDDYYDGLYIFFRAVYTNTYGKVGTANSLPVFLHKNAPSRYFGSGGWSTNGVTSSLTQTGTPIKFNYSYKNEYYRSIDKVDSVIEWYRGYPQSDKSNLVQSTEFIYSVNEYDDTTEYSGYDEYVPQPADVGYYIYIKTYASNSFTKSPMYGSPVVDQYVTGSSVSAKPTIVTMPSLSKVDGYQTVSYLLRGNTGTYNVTPTKVYWGFQYASSATTPDLQWSTFQTRYFSPISYSYIYTNYYGNENYENLNHDLYIPSTIWNGSSEVSLVGKYLRFYSIADGAGTQSDTYYSNVIGPIYQNPTASGTPSISFSSAYSSSYAYIRATWAPASYTIDYILQYKSGSNWIDLKTLVDAPQYIYEDFLVPTGNQTFRVKTRNAENIYAYSSEVTFNVPNSYSFAFGNYLYPNTNGQIGLDNGSSTVYPSSGRSIAVYPLDLSETTTGYYSDGRYYYIQFSGYQYQNVGVAAYALRYQVKFDSQNPGYADVLICNKGSSVPSTVVGIGLYSGDSQMSGLPGPYVISTNTTYRIYLNGSVGSFGQTQAQIPPLNFITHTRDSGTADDGYHSILTQTNQYETNMLSVTSASVNSTGISISFNGLNGYSYYNYEVRTGSYSGSLFTSGNSATSNPLTVGSLTGGTRYYVTVTPYNTLNQAGTAYQNFFDAPSNPGAFNVTSVSKTKPSTDGGVRQLVINWGQSANSVKYEIQVEGSTDNSTFSILTFNNGDGVSRTWSLNGSPYFDYGTGSVTFSNVPYYKYYRVTMRARGSDYSLTVAAYANGGTSTSYVYTYAVGSDPSDPTGVTVSASGTTGLSVSYTNTTSTGSNFLSGVQYKVGSGGTWSSTTTSNPISITGLSTGTSYTVYLRSENKDGYLSSGNASGSATTSSNAGAFSITGATAGTLSGGYRSVVINWNQSSGADRYEMQIEGRDYHPTTNPTASTTWTVLRSLAAAPYVYEPTRTETYSAGYYFFYRVTGRSRVGTDINSAAYSDGGSLASPVYVYATGTAPGAPTIGTITVGKTTASIPWSNETSGSIGTYKRYYKIGSGAWTETSSSPIALTGLSEGTTYTVYMKAMSYEGLETVTPSSKDFTTTTSKPPNPPTSITAGTKTNTSIDWSWTAPSADSTHDSPTGYEYALTSSSTTPTSGWTANSTTSKTTSSLTKNTTYYMHVRATNADGTSSSNYGSATTNNDSFYTVTFNVNGSGGTAPSSVTQSTAGGSVTLAAAITRTNCDFGGWNTASDGTGTNYSASATYTPPNDITLYAKWTAKNVSFTNPTVTFVGNSGSGSTSTKTWNWTTGSVTNGTATGYQWSISSAGPNTGFGAFSSTITAQTLTLTVANASSNPRWLKVRKVATDGLGVTQVSGTNAGV